MPGVPCLALTATATQKVRDDIVSCLRLPAARLRQFRAGVFRDNLFYEVCFADLLRNPIQDLARFVREMLGVGEDAQQSGRDWVSRVQFSKKCVFKSNMRPQKKGSLPAYC